MANEEQLAILRQGVWNWHVWQIDKLRIEIDLRDADLVDLDLTGVNLTSADLSGAACMGTDFSGARLDQANLMGADLSGATLYGADFTNADLSRTRLFNANLDGIDLSGANLSRAYLSEANLCDAVLRGTNLTGANLYGANLTGTDFYNANLSGADLRETTLINSDLSGANLSGTNLSSANLTGANLRRAILVNTVFANAVLSRCKLFGISAWKLNLERASQSDLIITDVGEPVITVDNLEVAQFVYLLLHNEKLRGVIDTLTTKSVLILGRFTNERKAVLDAIKDELRKRGYVPILFDSEKPANRDLTETVMTLASLARFVIADLSDPHSIPHELMAFAEKLLSVPVQGIFCATVAHPKPYPMYEHLRRYPHVLPTVPYATAEELIGSLAAKVIGPAEEMVKKMRPSPLS